jgi:hypothetical protein
LSDIQQPSKIARTNALSVASLVELNAVINNDDATKVDVSGRFGLRDWSGEWDDPYSGRIDFAVFTDLAAVAPPAPGDARGDLIIVDAEITQVIQHFLAGYLIQSPCTSAPFSEVRHEFLDSVKSSSPRKYEETSRSSGLHQAGVSAHRGASEGK